MGKTTIEKSEAAAAAVAVAVHVAAEAGTTKNREKTDDGLPATTTSSAGGEMTEQEKKPPAKLHIEKEGGSPDANTPTTIAGEGHSSSRTAAAAVLEDDDDAPSIRKDVDLDDIGQTTGEGARSHSKRSTNLDPLTRAQHRHRRAHDDDDKDDSSMDIKKAALLAEGRTLTRSTQHEKATTGSPEDNISETKASIMARSNRLGGTSAAGGRRSATTTFTAEGQTHPRDTTTSTNDDTSITKAKASIRARSNQLRGTSAAGGSSNERATFSAERQTTSSSQQMQNKPEGATCDDAAIAGAEAVAGLVASNETDDIGSSASEKSDGGEENRWGSDPETGNKLVSAFLVVEENERDHKNNAPDNVVVLATPLVQNRRRRMVVVAAVVLAAIITLAAVVTVVVVVVSGNDKGGSTPMPVSTIVPLSPSPTRMPTTTSPMPSSSPTIAPSYTQASTGCGSYRNICSDPNALVLEIVSNLPSPPPSIAQDAEVEHVTLPFGFNWFGDTVITSVAVAPTGQINIDGSGSQEGDDIMIPRIEILASVDLAPSFPTFGSVCVLNNTGSSSVTISYENIGIGIGFVYGQAVLFPNGNVELRWGDLGGSVTPRCFSSGLHDLTRDVPESFPAAGFGFDENGLACFDGSDAGPSNQCRIFSTGFQSYSESSSNCGAFLGIADTPEAVEMAEVSTCANNGFDSAPCTESVALSFAFPWFGDTPVSIVSVSSNGQINLDNSVDLNTLADPVVVGGNYTRPRIAVAQDSLQLFPLRVYFLDKESSVVISWETIESYSNFAINAQAELFENGDVELRWGPSAGTRVSGVEIAAGLEDDTRIIPEAFPASGPPFDDSGIALDFSFPTGQCRRFTIRN